MLKSIATIKGDLSNITAPPFVLDNKSTVELPAFWAERPSVFVAPASSSDPAQRALLVLRWFLSSLRNQQYAGRDPSEGVKKPLNAFLGEVFLAKWEDDCGTTRMVSEQVSHHPPVTACRVWNDDHGVYADGYTRQEITFSGSVNIQQIGRATLYLKKWDETYLIPLPNVKVSGILTGKPYPELGGTYYIPSTSGYVSSIDFSGKGLFGSSDKKHSFEAKLYKQGNEDHSLYTAEGHWDSEFTIHDVNEDKDVETFDIPNAKTTQLQTEPIDQQDPWETRRAWRGVIKAYNEGDMQGISDSKTEIEEGQRQMRKDEQRDGSQWQRTFYYDAGNDHIAEQLAAKVGETINPQDTVGIWKFRVKDWEKGINKPYHGDLAPNNQRTQQPSRNNPEPLSNGVVNGTQHQHSSEEKQPEQVPLKNENFQDMAAKTDPPLPESVQQQDVEQEELESGVAGMNVKEQAAVEDFLRNQYTSTAS